MHTNLDDATWSAIAAGHVYDITGGSRSGHPDEVSEAAFSMFKDLINPETPHASAPDNVRCMLFNHAMEVGFRIAVATLTLGPDEARAKISNLVDRARVNLYSALQYDPMPPMPV